VRDEAIDTDAWQPSGLFFSFGGPLLDCATWNFENLILWAQIPA
jgi:hypothetical protein